MTMLRSLGVACVAAVLAGSAHAAEFVAVTGAVPATSCGAVRTPYAIGRTEVSNAEYAAFLNAVATQDDPNKLYTPLMAQHFWGGIERQGPAGAYAYAPKPGYADLPATFVSWYSATRYANWLHFGSPAGQQEVGTTEGTSQLGAYNTLTWTRNQAAQFWIPTCAEWRAAAFLDPQSGRYETYVSGSEPPKGANYFISHWAYPFPHLQPVSREEGTRSHIGTVNQAGNVLEWVEDRSGAQRLALGGSVLLPEAALRSGYADSEYPGEVLSSLGFRIAAQEAPRSIPHPHSEEPVSADSYVEVGYANADADPATGKGRVPYDYEIARDEISNGDYAEFLNAVAVGGDPHGLYATDMGSGVVGGIDRITVADGTATFRPKPGWETRPVTYLSWFDLARYANWMHFGKPKGEEVVGVTEGTAETGAYDTRAFPLGNAAYDPAALPERNVGATYVIPTDAEWYKAAYYDPEAGRYWRYPTRSDTVDTSAANFQEGDVLAEGAPFFVGKVDGFASSASAFGTRQQGGNVWEWVEDWRSRGEGGCWRCDEWVKGLRGGSFNYTATGLGSQNLDPGSPELGLFVYGGRLVHLPGGWRREPMPFPSVSEMVASAKRAVSANLGAALVGATVVGAFAATLAIALSIAIRRRFVR